MLEVAPYLALRVSGNETILYPSRLRDLILWETLKSSYLNLVAYFCLLHYLQVVRHQVLVLTQMRRRKAPLWLCRAPL